MKHILFPLLIGALGIFFPAGVEAQQSPLGSREAEAMIDRIVSERLGEDSDRIAALEDRVKNLERLVTNQPPAPQPSGDPTGGASGGIHVIASGETLSSIARHYGVSVADLAQENRIVTTDTIYIGDRLKIPGGTSKARNEPFPVTDKSATSYTVRVGDTLSRIAVTHGTSIDQLMSCNGLSNPDQIQVGQVLSLVGGSAKQDATPASEPAPTIASSDVDEESFHYYEVASGDTLSSIAKTFFTNVEEICRLNNIPAETQVKAGQQLIVPTKAYFEYLRKEGVIG